MFKYRSPVPKIAMALVSALLLAALVAACGGGDGDDKSPSTTGGAATTVKVTLKEFSVSPSVKSASAGTITFDVKNDGVIAHDFWVIKFDGASNTLPKANSIVEESKVTVSGKVNPIDKGKSETLKLNLSAGKYVLICNVPTHYEAGMNQGFEVK